MTLPLSPKPAADGPSPDGILDRFCDLQSGQDVERLRAELDRAATTEGLSLLEALLPLSAFRGKTALVSSFGAESAVLLHLVSRVAPDLPVIFLDTGKHFRETLLYRDDLAARLGLTNLQIASPPSPRLAREDPSGTLHESDPDHCCFLRKVDPLETALSGFSAWITGRKRFQALTRQALAPVEWDEETGRVKINPLAGWSAEQVAAYAAENQLPAHPLVADGFLSIGCAPCTRKTAPGEDPRAGRWEGRGKTECGIHR